MQITVAETAGFCFGVKRAVDSVYELAEKKKIVTLGELIHNKQAVEDMQRKGVNIIESIDNAPEDAAVVIRTHGVGADIIGRLEKNNKEYIDLTCPFVAKIHNIVSDHYDKGYTIIIVGDENHPEVKGINGHCKGSAIILYDNYRSREPDIKGKKICVVAQTTINREKFGIITDFIKNAEPTALIFETICGATRQRQAETQQLSQQSDIMLVVGGKHSSNTAKLYEIAKKNCPQTFSIETFEDLPQNVIYKNKKIGITAGASTPRCIIEEVYTKMEEKINNAQEEQFADLLEKQSPKTLNTGDIVTGTVAEIKGNEVIVDLSFKSDGIITLDNLTDDTSAKPEDLLKVGQEIEVYVVGVNDAEGKVVLSRKKVAAMENWKKLEAAFEEKTILEGKIIRVVKGGVIVLSNSSQVFIPARQVSERFVSDLQTLVNNVVRFRIIDLDKNKRRVVGSVRSVLEEERKAREDAFWNAVEVGKEYTGAVKSITSFGAFVDLGGVDGLIHISELSWNKIKHPSEIVKEGDVLKVYVKDMDKEAKKISLGYKKQEDNPWVIAQNKYNIGDVIPVKIVRMMNFGAFAEIIPGIDGLIHISQIANRRIGKPEDVLETGQVVDVKITDINWESKKISLSIRALIQEGEEFAPVSTEQPAAEEAPAAAEETPVEEASTEEAPVEETPAE